MGFPALQLLHFFVLAPFTKSSCTYLVEDEVLTFSKSASTFSGVPFSHSYPTRSEGTSRSEESARAFGDVCPTCRVSPVMQPLSIPGCLNVFGIMKYLPANIEAHIDCFFLCRLIVKCHLVILRSYQQVKTTGNYQVTNKRHKLIPRYYIRCFLCLSLYIYHKRP